MKVLILISGMVTGIITMLVVNLVGSSTVSKDVFDNALANCTRLEKGLEEANQKIIEHKKLMQTTNTLISERDNDFKKINEELSKLGGKPLEENALSLPKANLDELKSKITSEIERKDIASAIKTLKDMVSLGPNAYSSAYTLALNLGASFRKNKSEINMNDLYQAIDDINFLKWLISDPSLDKYLRRNALQKLPVLDYKAVKDLIPIFSVEKDSELKGYMIYLFQQYRTPETESGLINLLQNEPDSRTQRAIIRSISSYPGTQITNVLRQLSANNNPEVASEAKMALLQQNPPVTGFLITSLRKGSMEDTYGLKAGDIIVSSNGAPVLSSEWNLSLNMFQPIRDNGSCEVIVHRDGVYITAILQNVRLGIGSQGIFVRKQ